MLLRDGLNNFFVTFIEILKDREGEALEVENGITSGDYLQGFLLGTREALSEKDRPSLTITTDEVSARSIGALIALYERAVGLYASLTHINAYHQPGVEAGKKAAGSAIGAVRSVVDYLESNRGQFFAAPAIAQGIGNPDKTELVYKLANHMAANAKNGISKRPKDAWHQAEFGIAD